MKTELLNLEIKNVTSLRSTPFTTKTTFDQNSEQTGIEPIPPFIANRFSHGINQHFDLSQYAENLGECLIQSGPHLINILHVLQLIISVLQHGLKPLHVGLAIEK